MKLAVFQTFTQYYAYEETYWRAMETNYSEKSLNLTLASSVHIHCHCYENGRRTRFISVYSFLTSSFGLSHINVLR